MQVPVPYTFNNLKHYLIGARKLCREGVTNKHSESQLFEEIKKTGSNLLDVYTGNLSIEQVTKEITRYLKASEIYTREKLIHFLRNRKYLVLKLTDKSPWIIQIGDDENRYIHIHPGRTGNHVQRFHSNAWKTALVMYCLNLAYNHKIHTLEEINKIRVTHLQLSPMKRFNSSSRIMKAYEVICEM